VVKVGASTRKV